ncbi:DUF4376 domain-containing protein [Pseudomonas sp. GG8]
MSIDWSKLNTASDKSATALAATKADIASRRFTAETRGITLNGMSINTDRTSQGLITGAVVETLLDPTYVCNWKTSDGWVQLQPDVTKAVGQAVRAHVQSCFNREGVLSAAVSAGTYTDAMLEEGWPV